MSRRRALREKLKGLGEARESGNALGALDFKLKDEEFVQLNEAEYEDLVAESMLEAGNLEKDLKAGKLELRDSNLKSGKKGQKEVAPPPRIAGAFLGAHVGGKDEKRGIAADGAGSEDLESMLAELAANPTGGVELARVSTDREKRRKTLDSIVRSTAPRAISSVPQPKLRREIAGSSSHQDAVVEGVVEQDETVGVTSKVEPMWEDHTEAKVKAETVDTPLREEPKKEVDDGQMKLDLGIVEEASRKRKREIDEAESNRISSIVSGAEQKEDPVRILSGYTSPTPTSPAAHRFSPGSPTFSSPDRSRAPDRDGKLEIYLMDTLFRRNKIYLFGKAPTGKDGSYINVSVVVQNVFKKIYVLPKWKRNESGTYLQPSDKKQLDTLVKKTMYAAGRYLHSRGIKKPMLKPVKKKYCFGGDGIPTEAIWVEAKYNTAERGSDSVEKEPNVKEIACILGTTNAASEQFIVGRSIKGPCWLELSSLKPVYGGSKATSCAFEYSLEKEEHIEVMRNRTDIPPISGMVISTKTIVPAGETERSVVMLTAQYYEQMHGGVAGHKPRPPETVVYFRKLRNVFPLDLQHAIKAKKSPYLSLFAVDREQDVLSNFFAFLRRKDPDLLAGHALVDFHLDSLLARVRRLKVSNWALMGRMRRTEKVPRATSIASVAARQASVGRLLVDTFLSAKEFKRATNYTLETLSEILLNVQRAPFENTRENMEVVYQKTDSIMKAVFHTIFDAELTAQLVFRLDLLPMTSEIASVTGSLWSRVLTSGRAERIEFLLLHEFMERNYIPPDKQRGEQNSGKRGKPKYAGGLVLEPKSGLYDKYILLLDYNSLYPSVIIERNICFTTVNLPPLGEDGERAMAEVPGSDVDVGVLPRVIRNLVQRRAAVKSKLAEAKEAKERDRLNTKQLALKLAANSMYGCLGFTSSRFYGAHIAELITSEGRSYLMEAKRTAEDMQLEVIYGDTDSIMVNSGLTDLAKAKDQARLIKNNVNIKFKYLELDIDGIFRMMLLLKKKKYAALVVEEKNGVLSYKREVKGLDMVRRDWCQISKNASNKVLQRLFAIAEQDKTSPQVKSSEDAVEQIHKDLRDIGESIRGVAPVDRDKRMFYPRIDAEGTLSCYNLEAFAITKMLTRDLDKYAAPRNMPHVMAALSAGKTLMREFRSGMAVPYVVTLGTGTPSERAKHPDELRKDPNLVIDVDWYLSTQIHPPVSRMCSVIDGTSAAQLAGVLGLNTSRFTERGENNEEEDDFAIEGDFFARTYGPAPYPFTMSCPTCRMTNAFPAEESSTSKDSLEPVVMKNLLNSAPSFRCIKCANIIHRNAVVNQLANQVRKYHQRYFSGVFSCNDPACSYYVSEEDAANSFGIRLLTQRQQTVHESRRAGQRCMVPKCAGTRYPVYSTRQFWGQLEFFRDLFDLKSPLYKKDENGEPVDLKGRLLYVKHKEQLAQLNELVGEMDKVLAGYARHYVDFSLLLKALPEADDK